MIIEDVRAMKIMRVSTTLVSTNRIHAMGHLSGVSTDGTELA
jgi:hypothetical protein